MRFPFVLAALLVALFAVPVFAQKDGEFLDLAQDQYVTGGLNPEVISRGLLPAFIGHAPKVKGDEVVVFAFNYDIPKLQLAFRDGQGRVHTRTGRLAKGEKLVATINSRKEDGHGNWSVNATVRWAHQCGNPLPHPFEVDLTIPKWGGRDRTVIERVEVPRRFAVSVERDVIVQQIVPSIGNIELNLPPAEHGRYRLVEVGHEQADRRWEYRKDLWDNFLDFLRVAAFPIGQIYRATDNVNLTAIGLGGQGGNGYGAAAAAAAAASSSSATSSTPTSAAGTSGSGGSSSSGAAGGGDHGGTTRAGGG